MHPKDGRTDIVNPVVSRGGGGGSGDRGRLWFRRTGNSNNNWAIVKELPGTNAINNNNGGTAYQ